MTLDAIAVHVVDTTASSGAEYRETVWAATVRFVVANRQFLLVAHLETLAIRGRIARPGAGKPGDWWKRRKRPGAQ